MKHARLSVAAIATTSLVLTGCGYTKLTKATFGDAIAKVMTEKKSVHEQITTTTGGNASADFDYASGKPAVRMLIAGSAGAQQTDIRIVDGLGYMSVGDKFIKFNKDTPDVGATITTVGNFSPKLLGDMIKNSATSVTYEGTEKIDSADKHKYKVSLDTAKVITALGVQASADDLAKLPKTVDEDIYLNDDNSIRRITLALPGGGTQTVDMTKWGQVHVAAPDSASVLDPSPSASPSAAPSSAPTP